MRTQRKAILLGSLVLLCLSSRSLPVDTNSPDDPDQLYAIKLKPFADQGRKTTVRTTVTTKDTEGDKEVLTQEEYVETVVEGGDLAPKKYKRTYCKSLQTINGEERELERHGETFLYELKNDLYTVRPERKGAKLDVTLLTREARKRFSGTHYSFIPRNPVKVRDVWSISPPKDSEAVYEVDLEKSKAQGKLLRVYAQDGVRCGVIEITISHVLVNPSGTLESAYLYDGAIDGKSTAHRLRATFKLVAKCEDGYKVATTVTNFTERSAEGAAE